MGVDTWNDAPTTTEGEGWKPDESFLAADDGWNPDSTGDGGDGGFTGGFAPENVSKHAGTDEGCRICGEFSHFARDCPDKRPNSGECFNCGEQGHNKADCPNPMVEREFTGNCRVCGEVGHRAAQCPSRPPQTCKICDNEGHIATECEMNRLTFSLEQLSVEDAWAAFVQADREKDVEDIKQAILMYAKAFPQVTFMDIEMTLREAGMNTFLIAKEQEISDTHTIVNLQGNMDQKYVISIQFSDKPRRAKFAVGWPSTTEDNLVRLQEAGWPMDRMVPKCDNCGVLGHGSKKCPEERTEPEKKVPKCTNCNEEGHYMRDCPVARKSGAKTCKNCGEEGHISKECEKPRSAENVECKSCGEMGHFVRDCPSRPPDLCRNCGQEGHRAAECQSERVMQCRNCDKWGHASRECDQPKDWSRVTCSNCDEKGHGAKRCPNPPKEVEAEDGDGGWS